MQIDFTLRELGDLYRKGKEKENWNVQIPERELRRCPNYSKENERHFTFWYLVMEQIAPPSSVFVYCLRNWLPPFSASFFVLLPPRSLRLYDRTSVAAVTLLNSVLCLKVACGFNVPSPPHVCSQMLNKTYREPSQWWRTLMISQMYTHVPSWGGGSVCLMHFVIVLG